MAWKLFYEHEGEWKINMATLFLHSTLESSLISPLSNHFVQFQFIAKALPSMTEQTYCDIDLQLLNPFEYQRSLANQRRMEGAHTPEFSLKLVKIDCRNISSSLRMNLEVKLYDRKQTIIQKFLPKNNIKVKELQSFVLEYQNVFSWNFQSSAILTAKYKMSFIDNICTLKLQYDKENSEYASNLKAMFESSELSDVVINVHGTSFLAHKVILGAHSPVFRKMMTSDFKESKTDCVTITDAAPETVDQFLKYLYSNQIEDKSWPSVKELYYLADKYDVGILKNDCRKLAESLINVDLVCDILKLAFDYEDSLLKSLAITFAVNHIKEVVASLDWKDLVKTHPTIAYEVVVNFVPK